MKQKLSITIDEEKIKLIERILQDGLFRNKSHILEYSLNKFLNENKEQTNSGAKNVSNNK